MTPRAARKRLLMIWAGAFLLALVYVTLLEPLDIPIVNALVCVALIALIIVYLVIKNKYFRCTKCGRSLSFRGEVSSIKKCPYCNAEIE